MTRLLQSRREIGRGVLARLAEHDAAELIAVLVELARAHAPHGLTYVDDDGPRHVKRRDAHGGTLAGWDALDSSPNVARAVVALVNGDDDDDDDDATPEHDAATPEHDTPPGYRQSAVSLDNADESWPAWVAPDTWNGWARPAFDDATMERIAAFVASDCDGWEVRRDGDGWAWIDHDEGLTDRLEPIMFGGVPHWPLGAGSWCWWEDPADDDDDDDDDYSDGPYPDRHAAAVRRIVADGDG